MRILQLQSQRRVRYCCSHTSSLWTLGLHSCRLWHHRRYVLLFSTILRSDSVKEWLAPSRVSTLCIGNSEMPSVRSVRSTGESRQVIYPPCRPDAKCLQNAFHQNLTQMRETARAFILSLPQGKGEYSRDFGDEQPQGPKSSGLRHYVGDDSSDVDDGLVMNQGHKGGRF